MQYILIAVIVISALAVVIYPLIRRKPDSYADMSDEAIERQIGIYRDAIEAGTVCEHCTFANVSGAKFCQDCGKPIGAEAIGDER